MGSQDGVVADDGRGRSAERPSDIPARGWKDIALRVKAEIRDDHTTLVAAGVAYYGFLAAIPAMAAVVSIYGLFVGPSEVQQRVRDLFGGLPDEARALLASQLESIVARSGGRYLSASPSVWCCRYGPRRAGSAT